jgi:hypothetical protein
MSTIKSGQRGSIYVKQAQKIWRNMTSDQHNTTPEGQGRTSQSEHESAGSFFRITVRPKEQYVSFRNYNVDGSSGLIRVAGRKRSGTWDTHAWLLSKDSAHQEDDYLLAETEEARNLFSGFSDYPTRVAGDEYEATLS